MSDVIGLQDVHILFLYRWSANFPKSKQVPLDFVSFKIQASGETCPQPIQQNLK